MSEKLRSYLAGLSLIALIGAIGYLNIRPESFIDEAVTPAASSDIDLFVDQAVTHQFQDDGSLRYRLTATRLEHFNSSDSSRLDNPNLLLYRGDPLPWQISSTTGEVGPEGKQVELIDQVRIARTDGRGRPTVISTSRATVFPDEQYAHTDQAVRIEAANGVTTAQGMKAYMNDGKIKLLSNVRGQHEVR